ncbi:hypothetical protein BpHYR1_034605 [Brachionus plicatilis]|uniref:Uncharacterized protein n=1 Tax=Brachionus plicatilis TaxID=10195 RepID=A0A3M7SZQ0_BRAPC|nr:hypothetical protein BpHYR1_034605 [Brachionus plicatilis]
MIIANTLEKLPIENNFQIYKFAPNKIIFSSFPFSTRSINTQKPDIFYTSKDRRCQMDTFYINLQNTAQILGFSIIVLHPSRICTLYDQI